MSFKWNKYWFFVLCIIFSCFCFNSNLLANQNLENQELAEEILSQKEFETKIETKKYTIPETKPPSSSMNLNWLGGVMNFFLWCILICIGVYLIYLLIRYIILLKKNSFPLKKEAKKKSYEILGEVIEPDSLPSDIGGRAWELWQEGKNYESMHLLYVGTITKLILNQVPLEKHHTERECLQILKDDSLMKIHYLWIRELILTWQLYAYGQILPDTEKINEICLRWTKEFISLKK